jgi:hypothetical protein
VDEFRNKIYPPSKAVLFNPHLLNNDGLLGNYVAQQKDLDYAASLTFITESTNEWRSVLDEGKRLEVGEIGFLYLKDGKVQFEQSREVNLLLAAYGLTSIDFVDFSEKQEKTTEQFTPVHLELEEKKSAASSAVKSSALTEQQPVLTVIEKPIEKQKKEEQPTVIALNKEERITDVEQEVPESSDPDIIPIRRSRLGTALRYTAAIAIVPLLFYSYWIPMETDALDTQAVQFSDFNPIHTQVKRTYKSRISEFQAEPIEASKSWEEMTVNIDAEVYNFEFSEDFYVTVALEKEALVDLDDNTEVSLNDLVEEVEHNEMTKQDDYHIISGCFSVVDNANNLVSDLNLSGFKAQILDNKGGLNRVSAGGFSTRGEAKSALEKVKSNGFSGWILKY